MTVVITDRAKKKPLPSTLRFWLSEVEGIEKFIASVERHRPEQGDEWVDKQTQYYRERLMWLKMNQPEELKPRRRARREHPLYQG